MDLFFILSLLKRRYYILLLFCLTFLGIWANSVPNHGIIDSVSIRKYKVLFRISHTDIEESYLSNAKSLQQIRLLLTQSDIILDSIFISSTSSPEGPYWLNKRYAEQRAHAARNYLQNLMVDVQAQQIPDSLIRVEYTAENWEGLRELVQHEYHRPDRAKLIRLLHTRRIDDTHRKLEIQQLDEGRTWNYLLKNYMPQLRQATWIFIYYTTLVENEVEQVIVEQPIEELQETVVVETEVDTLNENLPVVEKPIQILSEDKSKTRFAIKSNLLYDAATLLNLSVEYPFTWKGQHFSVLAQHQFPWWDFKENRRVVRFLSTGIEGRWWFKPHFQDATAKRLKRDALVGHFLGLYALSGKWDFQWDRDICYQGEFWSTGLVYGYSMPIAKRLNLEFTIALGYASIPYRHYIPSADWQTLYKDSDKQGTWHYLGPTRAEISLVLPLWGKAKKGGRQ